MSIRMKTIFMGLALAVVTLPVFSAPTITITAPVITFSGNNALLSGNGAQLDAALNAMFTGANKAQFDLAIANMQTQANTELGKYGSQEKLALGFANANNYSAQSATLQGYQGYKLFSLMGGVMIGAQLPSFNPAELTAIPDTIAEHPDIYAGFAPSLSFNLGVHPSAIIGIFNKDLGKSLEKFYMNVKYGTLSYTYPTAAQGDIKMNTVNFGLGLNYQWIAPGKSFLWGLAKWRGVNFGTGINYQSNKVTFSTDIAEISQAYSQTTPAGALPAAQIGTVTTTLAGTPKVNLGLEMTTTSIPLEATTSIQMLWLLNLNLGAGVDLVFGKTDITADSGSSFTARDMTVSVAGVTQTVHSTVVPGTIKLDASTKGINPSLARMRLMTGFGVQLGPVKIDVPIYYYFNTGLALGVSAGIVW